jgi:dUTP pyrophosphatase
MKMGGNVYHPTLFIYMDPNTVNENAIELYKNKAADHNVSVLSDPHPNSGFDIFFLSDQSFYGIDSKMVDFGIKCKMQLFDTINNQSRPTGFYLYPRSSISKTPLTLANQVGIIDSGYRGNIIGAFRMLSTGTWTANRYDRLLQICAPNLEPFLVQIVDQNNFEETTRGSGGFGSTG